jgi:dihydrodipicolinate synthase/N-acetylneuraminate lyase
MGEVRQMHTRTVIAIPPSYDEYEELELESTGKYLNYLKNEGASCVMTTAGTSHYSLLTIEEIHKLNKKVVSSFSGHKIIGVPALNIKEAKKFISYANNYIDEKTNLMLLYPERYYDDESMIEYFSDLRKETKNKIYIHAKVVRKGNGGIWNFTSNIINKLYDNGTLQGIKEEHTSLPEAYNFVSDLNKNIDVIVAGGSMRRYEFLKSAGANSFLAGVGNLFPRVEENYIYRPQKQEYLDIEKKMFKVFMKYGWHKSLRIALKYLDLTCYNDRKPWAKIKETEKQSIINVIEEIKNVK